MAKKSFICNQRTRIPHNFQDDEGKKVVDNFRIYIQYNTAKSTCQPFF